MEDATATAAAAAAAAAAMVKRLRLFVLARNQLAQVLLHRRGWTVHTPHELDYTTVTAPSQVRLTGRTKDGRPFRMVRIPVEVKTEAAVRALMEQQAPRGGLRVIVLFEAEGEIAKNMVAQRLENVLPPPDVLSGVAQDSGAADETKADSSGVGGVALTLEELGLDQSDEPNQVEVWSESDFYFDPFQNQLQPLSLRRMEPDRVRTIERTKGIPRKKFPGALVADPLVRRMGLQSGDVIQVTSAHSTAAIVTEYREVRNNAL